VFTSNPKFRGIAESRLKPGEVFDARIIKSLLKDNSAPLPPDISDEDLELLRNLNLGVANVRLNLEPCPQLPE
jgi:hypothetical protein